MVTEIKVEVEGEGEAPVLGINYEGMIPVLLAAIKEQQKQIEELRQKLEKAGIK